MRLRVVDRLGHGGPATVSELAGGLGMPMPQLSNHLRRLREAGLVRAERSGRSLIYSLADEGLFVLLPLLDRLTGVRRVPRRRCRTRPDGRTCYAHLAGRVGVALYRALLERDAVRSRADGTVEPGSAPMPLGVLGARAPPVRVRVLRRDRARAASGGRAWRRAGVRAVRARMDLARRGSRRRGHRGGRARAAARVRRLAGGARRNVTIGNETSGTPSVRHHDPAVPPDPHIVAAHLARRAARGAARRRVCGACRRRCSTSSCGATASLYLVHPADWEQLRHEEGGAGRGVPYWARPWPSGRRARGRAGAAGAGARVLELGCGLAAPSIAAARGGADVLATDGSTDAVAFAAHSLALNEVPGEVAHADWLEHGDALVERGPWDVVLAADVFYTAANVQTALRLLPRLLQPGGELRLADPRPGRRARLPRRGAAHVHAALGAARRRDTAHADATLEAGRRTLARPHEAPVVPAPAGSHRLPPLLHERVHQRPDRLRELRARRVGRVLDQVADGGEVATTVRLREPGGRTSARNGAPVSRLPRDLTAPRGLGAIRPRDAP